jgi:hypothetical protein
VTLTLILIQSWTGGVEIHKNSARAEIQGVGSETIFLAKPYHITSRVQCRDVPLQAEHVLFSKITRIRVDAYDSIQEDFARERGGRHFHTLFYQGLHGTEKINGICFDRCVGANSTQVVGEERG